MSNNVDYTKVLSRCFDAEWSLSGDNYEGLVWLSDTPKPTKEELDALWPSVKAACEKEIADAIAAKEAAQAKLAAFGLTANDLKALGL